MKIRKEKIKSIIEKVCENPYLFCAILGFLLNFSVELLSRKSLLSVWSYLTDRPLVFLYNSMAIAFTVSFALLVKRRVFAFSLLSILWLVMGVVNSVVLVFRTTPFTGADLLLVKSAYSIMGSYFSAQEILLLAIGTACLLILITGIFRKAPVRKERISYRNVACYIGGLFLIVYFSTLAGLETGLLADKFGNIGAAYIEYGFPYCFGNSILNTGMTRPADYSSEIVDELIAEAKQPITHSPYQPQKETEQEKPNLIFLQLESFFDPQHVKGVSFSENPVPNFTALKESCTSGYLSVPSVGAGTVNTEFEIITGMNLDFFGPGEYPYKTILKETTCESIAYNLKEEGYQSHVLHNNAGTFYERNQIYPQLGFDSFTSLEYMNAEQFTPMGWAKDSILLSEIRKSLRSTSKQDLVYAISVQGHGSYPSDPLENPVISVEGLEEEQNNSFEYYTNQIYEMDAFLGDLTRMLMEYPERVILVMYGDHLPGFDFTEADLKNGDIYQTEYVIWSNYNLLQKDRDLEAYQLSSYVLEQAELYNGTLTKYHQAFYQEENYLTGLELLQYDMLYGTREVYGGTNPFEPTELVMGTEPISLYGVEMVNHSLRIEGSNFTRYSKVAVNGDFVETEYVNRYTLVIHENLEPGDRIAVHQVGTDSISLSHTEEYLVPETAE